MRRALTGIYRMLRCSYSKSHQHRQELTGKVWSKSNAVPQLYSQNARSSIQLTSICEVQHGKKLE
jgi:hypothetical protein